MSSINLIITFLASLTVIWLLARPHLGIALTEGLKETSLLEERKERCVQMLKDLELDNATNKLDRADYESTKNQLEHELASILTALEKGR